MFPSDSEGWDGRDLIWLVIFVNLFLLKMGCSLFSGGVISPQKKVLATLLISIRLSFWWNEHFPPLEVMILDNRRFDKITAKPAIAIDRAFCSRDQYDSMEIFFPKSWYIDTVVEIKAADKPRLSWEGCIFRFRAKDTVSTIQVEYISRRHKLQVSTSLRAWIMARFLWLDFCGSLSAFLFSLRWDKVCNMWVTSGFCCYP